MKGIIHFMSWQIIFRQGRILGFLLEGAQEIMCALVREASSSLRAGAEGPLEGPAGKLGGGGGWCSLVLSEPYF